MTRIFMSASFPVAGHGPFSADEIGAATASVCEAVLRTGAHLVFGGHPTITPIVLHVAGLLNAGPQVELWQSTWFEGRFTPEARRLVEIEGADLHWVPAKATLEDSLDDLRTSMLQRKPQAAFFIGGMEGIEQEYRLVAAMKSVPAFYFASPGGRAAQLGEIGGQRDSNWLRKLEGRSFGSLALRSLREVGLEPIDEPPLEL